MKKLVPIIMLSVLAMVVGCSHGTHQRQLVQVDSLIGDWQPESAFQVFKQIELNELSGERERIYYDLLKVVLSKNAHLKDSIHFDMPRDSILKHCINYYLQNQDQRKLLYSYLYLGKIHLAAHDNSGASYYLKKSEELLTSVNDKRLEYLTYEALATLNHYSGNEELAMDYSYRTLACAEQSKSDLTMEVHACNHLLVLYMQKKNNDSIMKYGNLSLSILKSMPARNRSYALANLGAIYMSNNQLDSAEHYFEKAQSEMPQHFINQRLAEINYLRGDHVLADSLWGKALRTTELRFRVDIYQSIVSNKYGGGDYHGTADAAIRLLELKDSLVQQMQTAEVQEIQLKYDKEVERRKLDRFMMWALVGALVLLAFIAAGVIYHIRKANRAKEKMMRDQVLLNDYQRQIEELERSGEDTSKDIQALRKKMDALQAQQTEKLSEGRALYQRIVAGESAVAWSKEQVQKFIEYYKVVNLPFMLQMESDYARLSPGNRFFLILQDMGMSDEQMTHILGVSDGALRTTRSRLRQKRTPAPQQ